VDIGQHRISFDVTDSICSVIDSVFDADFVLGTVAVAVFKIGIHTELQQFKKLFRLLHISIQVSPQTTTLCMTDSYEFKFHIFSYYSDLLPFRAQFSVNLCRVDCVKLSLPLYLQKY